MKKNIVLNPLMLVCCLGLLSCSKIMIKLYGIKNIKAVNERTIIRYSKKYHIPEEDTYQLDTSYFAFLCSLDTLRNKSQIKNHCQPLQVLYYNGKGILESYQINCNAGGIPNLLWDRDGILTMFPPKQQTPVDSLVPFETQLKYLIPLSNSKAFSPKNFDYFVIVFWNRFMGRQSKRLVHFVQENVKLAQNKRIKIIYANNDNVFALTEK